MTKELAIQSANTILYCRKWQETVTFYRHTLKLGVTHATDWFVEFKVAEGAHLSVADERRATIKSSGGGGITLTFRVEDADDAWHLLRQRGLELDPVRDHAWKARLFYFRDPEGHRLEIWSSKS